MGQECQVAQATTFYTLTPNINMGLTSRNTSGA